MSEKSNIEWTDSTWNPVRGCTKVSAGCKHCYAETFAERWRGIPGHPFEQGFDLRLVPEKLAEPLKWRKPRRVFVNSMSDLFHEGVPNEYIAAVFGVMAATPQHTYQVLTKRPERMREWFEWAARLCVGNGRDDAERAPLRACGLMAHDAIGATGAKGKAAEVDLLTLALGTDGLPLPNAWLGVSVENQKAADERIPDLLATPAAVRFVSCEPLLEHVDLGPWLSAPTCACDDEVPFHTPGCPVQTWGDGSRIDWVIVGGESGPGARPFDIAWARSLVEQCRAAGAACFVKQLGKQPVAVPVDGGSPRTSPGGDPWPASPVRLRDAKGGDMAEWPEDLRVREFPNTGAMT